MFKINIPDLKFEFNNVKAIVRDSGSELLTTAKSNVHVRSGDLRDSISLSIEETSDGWIANVGSNLYYAPFEEFGTGSNVFMVTNGSGYSFSGEDRNIAKQFYVSGKGSNFAHPFLYPAYFEVRKKFVENLKKAIKW